VTWQIEYSVGDQKSRKKFYRFNFLNIGFQEISPFRSLCCPYMSLFSEVYKMYRSNNEATLDFTPISVQRSSATQEFEVPAIRAEMMKIQQVIQRLSSGYEEVIERIPKGLTENLSKLEGLASSLAAKVHMETRFDYGDSLNSISSGLAGLETAFQNHCSESRISLSTDLFAREITKLEAEVASKSDAVLLQLDELVKNRLEKSEKQAESVETTQLTLSTNFSSGVEPPQPEIVTINMNFPLDPVLQRRVRQHTERIRLIEEYFDDVLARQGSPSSPLLALQEVHKNCEANERDLELMEEAFLNIEAVLSDLDSGKMQKEKVVENADIVGRDTFHDFCADITTTISNLSSSVNVGLNRLERVFEDLEDGLCGTDRRISGFQQCAAEADAMVSLLSQRMDIAEKNGLERPRGFDVQYEALLKEEIGSGMEEMRKLRAKTIEEFDRIRRWTRELTDPNAVTEGWDVNGVRMEPQSFAALGSALQSALSGESSPRPKVQLLPRLEAQPIGKVIPQYPIQSQPGVKTQSLPPLGPPPAGKALSVEPIEMRSGKAQSPRIMERQYRYCIKPAVEVWSRRPVQASDLRAQDWRRAEGASEPRFKSGLQQPVQIWSQPPVEMVRPLLMAQSAAEVHHEDQPLRQLQASIDLGPGLKAPHVEFRSLPDSKDKSPRPIEEAVQKDESPRPIEESVSKDKSPPPVEESVSKDESPPPIEESVPKGESPLPIEESAPKDESQRPIEESVPKGESPRPIEESVPKDESPQRIEEKAGAGPE
jgi:hypothetical protein